MQNILARQIAQLVAECDTGENAREAARSLLAEAHRNEYAGPEFVQEVCHALRDVADREPDAGRKRSIVFAVDIVCKAAEELSADAAASG